MYMVKPGRNSKDVLLFSWKSYRSNQKSEATKNALCASQDPDFSTQRLMAPIGTITLATIGADFTTTKPKARCSFTKPYKPWKTSLFQCLKVQRQSRQSRPFKSIATLQNQLQKRDSTRTNTTANHHKQKTKQAAPITALKNLQHLSFGALPRRLSG